MVKKEKPLSPHITIYKPQITSILSIAHRISGVALFFGLIALVWWIAFLAYGDSDPTQTLVWEFFSHPVGRCVLIIWSYSLFFHFFTGIRHLFWDIGAGFSSESVNVTGWAAVAASFVSTLIAWGHMLN